MTQRLSCESFRDDLAAAVQRADRLAQDNVALRTRLAARRFDWVQWLLVGVIALCAVATVCILMTAR